MEQELLVEFEDTRNLDFCKSKFSNPVFSPPFNKLTPAEAERIALILEEAGEIVQVCGKILRHGFESEFEGSTNRKKLEKEIGDLRSAVLLAIRAGDVADNKIEMAKAKKTLSVQKYLHHQK